MTDKSGTADELVLKIGVKVDDSQYLDLKKELQNNKESSIKLGLKTPSQIEAEKKLMTPPRVDLLPPSLKDLIQGPPKPKIITETAESQTDFLEKIFNSSEKSSSTLSRIYHFMSKGKHEEGDEGKQAEGEGSGGFSLGSIISMVTGIAGTIFNAVTAIQKNYVEKLNRDLDFATLAYQTNSTADNMAKLSYQAKNVGLNFESMVYSAENSAQNLMSGQDDHKTALFAALGLNPIESLRGVKTLEDYQKWQIETFKKAKAALERGSTFPFLATKQAAELAGIPESEAYSYTAFGSKKNRNLAEETKKRRGIIGDKDEVLGNYMEITSSMQNKMASTDKLLSRDDIAKKLSIKTAEIQAGTVNLINATLDFGGVGEKDSLVEKFLKFLGATDDSPPNKTSYSNGPSASAQVKAGSQ